MWRLRRLKEEIDRATEEADAAAERAAREKDLQKHLAVRLRRIQLELDTLSRQRRSH